MLTPGQWLPYNDRLGEHQGRKLPWRERGNAKSKRLDSGQERSTYEPQVSGQAEELCWPLTQEASLKQPQKN